MIAPAPDNPSLACVPEKPGVFRLDPAGVPFAKYETPVTGGKCPLSLILKIAGAIQGHPPESLLYGVVRGGNVCFCGQETGLGRRGDQSINTEYRLLPGQFGIDAKATDGHSFYVRLEEVRVELKARADAEDLVSRAYRKIQWSGDKGKRIERQRAKDAALAELRERDPGLERDGSGKVNFARVVASFRADRVKATVQPSPIIEPKPMPKPTQQPEPAPAPKSPQPSLSANAQALVDALAKIGKPADKAAILAVAKVARSDWSDALSEAYRARRITRDRSSADVLHTLVG
jgi:hypothetical protein